MASLRGLVLLVALATPVGAHAGDARDDAAGLLRLAREHQAAARFAEAADAAERYAAHDPQGEATAELLQDAASMRFALGQRAQGFVDLDRLERLLQRVDPRRAAEVYWSRRGFLSSDDERLAHARTFLARHAKASALDRRIIAELTVAQILWRRACEAELYRTDELCAAPRWSYYMADWQNRDRYAGHRSGPRWDEKRTPRCAKETGLRIYPRNRARAADAQRRFAAVLRLAASGEPEIAEDQPQRRREYDDAVGLAALYAADQGLEQLLADEAADHFFIEDAPRREAKGPIVWRVYRKQLARDAALWRRLQKYIERSARMAAALEQRYDEIADTQPSLRVRIAAAARLGQLAEYRAEDLVDIEIPAGLPRGWKAARAFCDEFQGYAEPLYARAAVAYGRCLERSITTHEFTEYSWICEHAVRRLDRSNDRWRSEITSHATDREDLGRTTRPIVFMEGIDVQLDPTPFMPAGGT